MKKNLFLYLLLCLLIISTLGFGISEYLMLTKQIQTLNSNIDTKDKDINKLNETIGNCQSMKYINEVGHFSVIIPNGIYTKDFTVDNSEYTSGGTSFSFDKDDLESGIVITYAIPEFNGKGGSCLDDNGNGAYTKETIASQEVEVCDVSNSFSASYFKNPNRDIEYVVEINREGKLTSTQVSELKSIIKSSLGFN